MTGEELQKRLDRFRHEGAEIMSPRNFGEDGNARTMWLGSALIAEMLGEIAVELSNWRAHDSANFV